VVHPQSRLRPQDQEAQEAQEGDKAVGVGEGPRILIVQNRAAAPMMKAIKKMMRIHQKMEGLVLLVEVVAALAAYHSNLHRDGLVHGVSLRREGQRQAQRRCPKFDSVLLDLAC
jgi:hypothetical protein